MPKSDFLGEIEGDLREIDAGHSKNQDRRRADEISTEILFSE